MFGSLQRNWFGVDEKKRINQTPRILSVLSI